MVFLKDFAVEQFMDKYETNIAYNMGETCVDSLTIEEILKMNGVSNEQFAKQLASVKLTYGAIRGSDQLKSKICGLYNDNTDGTSQLVSEDVVVTNGAIGGNFLLLFTLINPGDKVIAVEPSYQQLTSLPQTFSDGNLIKFELKFEDGYQPDLEKLQALLEEHKPKLLVINNPNNPTGVVWNNSTLEKIVDLCRAHGTYLFSDEVYRPLFHSVDAADTPKSIIQFGYDRTISTGSMSKAFSLAGLRLGWIASKNKDLISDLFSKRDYNTISISMVDDLIASLALNCRKQILSRNYAICTENLKLLDNFISESQGLISWVKPVSGTTCFVKLNCKVNTLKLCEELAEQSNTLAVPGETFGYPGFIRIGFGNSASDLQGGLQALKTWLGANNFWK